MSTGQPRRIDPWVFAMRDEPLELPIAIEDMGRLSQVLAAGDGWSRLQIRGQRGDDGRPHLRGWLTVQVTLQCQRCLESFQAQLATDFDYTLVESESAGSGLGPDADPLPVAPGSTVNLVELAEDELILALPIVAMHPQAADCAPAVRSFGAEREESPFSRLGDLWAQRGSKHEE